MVKRKRGGFQQRSDFVSPRTDQTSRVNQVRTISPRTWKIIAVAIVIVIILFLIQPAPKAPLGEGAQFSSGISQQSQPIDLQGQSTLELPTTGDITSPSNTLGDILKKKFPTPLK